MLWNSAIIDAEELGARLRREHSAWLTRALASGRRYPRIPLRAERTGGFSFLRRLPSGNGQAATWWRLALGRIDS